MAFEDGSDRIIGAAIEVHRSLGPGFLESIYEKALRVELRREQKRAMLARLPRMPFERR